MKKIGIVGDALLSTGLAFVGIKSTFIVKNGEEAEKAVRTLLEDHEIGIIVIAERLVKEITNRKLHNMIESSIMPMFVPVPSYKEEVKTDVLRNLIIRAIGIDITKK